MLQELERLAGRSFSSSQRWLLGLHASPAAHSLDSEQVATHAAFRQTNGQQSEAEPFASMTAEASSLQRFVLIKLTREDLKFAQSPWPSKPKTHPPVCQR